MLKSQTYNWGGLTTLLSIFLFLTYISICLDVAVYIMIYRCSKIRAWYAVWFNINEIQPSKFIGNDCNLIFLDSALFF